MRRAITIGTGLAIALALVLLAPLAIIVASAFAPSDALGVSSEQWVAGAGAGRAFRTVLDTYGHHLVVSIEVALIAGVLALVAGALAGFALATDDSKLARALEALLTLPLAVPGVSAAVALLTAYPGRGGGLGLLVVGHALYTLPYAVRTVSAAAGAAQLDRVLDAARTLGAGSVARMRHIVIPALRRALGAALLVTFAVSWGEFNVSFLLASPSSGTFPTALYLTYTTNSFPVAAAATTLLLVGLVPLVALALWIGRPPAQAA